MFLDFSKEGWKEAVKEFFFSLLKTLLAAALTFAGARLAEYPITATTGPEIVAAIALVRAFITAGSTWLTTHSFQVTKAPVVETPIEVVG